MNKFFEKIEDKLLPLVEIVQSNKYLSAIQYGMMCMMPLMMVGAFCCVISDFPLDAYQTFMAGVFGEELWANWNWSYINVATMGISSIAAIIGTTYELARKDKVNPIPAVIVALMSFFLVMAFTEDGGGFLFSEFSARNLFLALIISIGTEALYNVCIKKNITIKMPDTVPAFVSQQFTAVVPAALCCIIFLVIRVVASSSSFGTVSNVIYTILQAPLTNLGTSFVGTIVCTILNSLIWMFGIHGTNVIQTVWTPLWQAARDANLQVYIQNAAAIRPYIVTDAFGDMVIFLTGTGLTLPLVIEMIFMCKSARIKAVGKTALIPGIFNVNEPVIFGLPIVLNPVMLIPFVLSPVVCVSLAYFVMDIGLVPRPTGTPVPWTLPAPFGGWMMTGSWTGGLLQIVLLIISGLIYFPFIKALDKKYKEEENLKAIEKTEENKLENTI
ncbi:PTS sugar transporter subunit IIC [Anaerorhabdus sp.]|uniref:PTS sugar transporter subunit IIC n=1 Tax=Anaerorhabdus sp. TaxID=1872524 RepID=UPI002FCC4BA8